MSTLLKARDLLSTRIMILGLTSILKDLEDSFPKERSICYSFSVLRLYRNPMGEHLQSLNRLILFSVLIDFLLA